MESEDHVEINGIIFNKPFVEVIFQLIQFIVIGSILNIYVIYNI